MGSPVLVVSVLIMGCCFMKRNKKKSEKRNDTLCISLPLERTQNAYMYAQATSSTRPVQANRPEDPGYDKLCRVKGNLLKVPETERDTAKIYSHLASQEADWDCADESHYDTTLRKHGGKPVDKEYDKVFMQGK
ncbi:uncharacterized protein LOC124136832 isoform X2 [Haliotis rufescens]|uniref:uncharacterized protein LOC124136832 isoform X2 n=1 Tax=Haliotis rufescens TaxID=6454 RepID=UPI00201F84E8|nr:uncharacterized protein LOC124136832 isoform X2 [Haliotis rufescens]